jgi:hypothetical protein
MKLGSISAVSDFFVEVFASFFSIRCGLAGMDRALLMTAHPGLYVNRPYRSVASR